MVLVVNKGLEMSVGKIGAQCGHGTLNAYKEAEKLAGKSKFWEDLLDHFMDVG